jgi:hypothetical protein
MLKKRIIAISGILLALTVLSATHDNAWFVSHQPGVVIVQNPTGNQPDNFDFLPLDMPSGLNQYAEENLTRISHHEEMRFSCKLSDQTKKLHIFHPALSNELFIRIYNPIGQLVFLSCENGSDRVSTFDLSSLDLGIYVVGISYKQIPVLSQKIQIQNSIPDYMN